MCENIYMLNVHVNKFLWVPYKDTLTQENFQVQITVHVLLTKRLLVTYTSLFCYIQKQLNAVRSVQRVIRCNQR